MKLETLYLVLSALLCLVGLRLAAIRLRAKGRIKIAKAFDEKIAFVWAVVSAMVAYTYWAPTLLVVVAGGFVLNYVGALMLAAFVAPRWAAGDGTLILPRPFLLFDVAWTFTGLVLCTAALLLYIG